MRASDWSKSRHETYTNIQIVTDVEVTVENCPKVWEIFPDAQGGGQHFQNWGETIPNSDR